MNIQAISYAQRPAFKGIEQKDDPNQANIYVNGGGGRIGKPTIRQNLLAKHTPTGVYDEWDTYRDLYANQNLVAINMGSMGLKKDQSINDVDDKTLLSTFRRDSVMGKLPDGIKTGIERKDGEVFLKVSSDYGEDETIQLIATRDTAEMAKMAKHDVDIVKDCTGNKAALTKKGLAEVRDALGARYALLSAPSKELDKKLMRQLKNY